MHDAASELADRVARFPWLAPTAREAALAAGLEPRAQLRQFLDGDLTLIERDIVPWPEPDFAALIGQLVHPSNHEVRDALGCEPPVTRYDWFHLAAQMMDRPSVAIYCLANGFATPEPGQTGPSEVRALGIMRLGDHFYRLKLFGRTVSLLAAEIGLANDDYDRPDKLQSLFAQLQTNGWVAQNVTALVLRMAKHLAIDLDAPRAVAVLTAYIGLDSLSATDPVQMRAAWDRLSARASAAQILSVARLLANVLAEVGNFIGAVSALETAIFDSEVSWETDDAMVAVLTATAARWAERSARLIDVEDGMIALAHAYRTVGDSVRAGRVTGGWARYMADPPVPVRTTRIGRLLTQFSRWQHANDRARAVPVHRLRLLWTELAAAVVDRTWLSLPQKLTLLYRPRWLGYNETNWRDHAISSDEEVLARCETLEAYLNRLATVERVFDPLRSAGFLDVCAGQRRCRTPGESLRDLNFDGDLDDLDYLDDECRPYWPNMRQHFMPGSCWWMFITAQMAVDPTQWPEHSVPSTLAAVSELAVQGWDSPAGLRHGLEWFGLKDEDFQQPARLRERDLLHPRGRPDLLDACWLGQNLWMVGRREHARQFMLASGGLSESNVTDGERLNSVFGSLVARYGEAAVHRYVFGLTKALQLCGRSLHAIGVLSSWLGIDLNMPLQESELSSLHRQLSRFRPANAIDDVGEILAHLSFSGRLPEAIRLAEIVSGITQYSDSNKMQTSFEGLKAVNEAGAAGLVGKLGKLLLIAGRREDGTRLLLEFAGLEYADLAKGAFDERRRKLDAFRKGRTPNNGAIFVTKLADALIANPSSNWYGAVWLLEAFAGIERQAGDICTAAWWYETLAFREFLAPDTIVHYFLMLAKALAGCSQYPIAARWLGTVVGVSESQDEAGLTESLRAFRETVQPNTYSFILNYLVAYSNAAEGMIHGGSDTPSSFSARLLSAEPGNFDWLDSEYPFDISCWNVPNLISVWLNSFVASDQERVLDVCRRTVAYVRRQLANPHLLGSHRLELVRELFGVRFAVMRAGFYWAGRLAGESAAALWREVLAWDAELGQRLLLERLQVRGKFRGPIDPKWLPRTDWEPLPMVSGPSEPAGVLLREDRPGTHQSGDDWDAPAGRTTDDLQPHLALLRRPLESGVLDRDLAASMAEHDRFLRVRFDRSGRLNWALVAKGEENTLAVLATGTSGDAALPLIRAAAVRHELTVNQAWTEHRHDPEVNRFECHLIRIGPLTADGLSRRFQDFRRVLADGKSQADVTDFWNSLLDRLESAGGRVLAAYLGRGMPDFNAGMPVVLADALARWDDLTGFPAACSVMAAAERLTRALDTATEKFLKAVADVWDLRPLAPFLFAETDLYVQPDDALHAVPFAFLPVDGGRLFDRVRTVQVVLSPLLAAWLKEVDIPIREPTRRLMALSYVEGRLDLAARGAAYLHRQHWELARDQAIASHLSDQGSHAGLAGALAAHGPFPLVTVCGHGTSPPLDFRPTFPFQPFASRTAAVRLADGDWTGGHLLDRTGRGGQTACDLSNVEFLVQVSCSVGRVADRGWTDADGFCVELAVSRCRSTFAALWPIHTVHAAKFVTDVAAEYIKLRDEEANLHRRSASEAALRGRAVAMARRNWQKAFTPGDGVGLNTAAAFQLYGLP
ncbi:MAG TPA: hypothetical protein VHR66_31715 [Gemmataceae bacterium]|jgi:hypothetical protein|nr:hypothetical protein [Gemmataceae bacterium]